jgi:phosphate transport system protein
MPINREIRAIDARCHGFVARHLPTAGHLRFVSSVLRLDIAIERVGDYAAGIARAGVQLSAPPPAHVARIIGQMAGQSRAMMRQALKAWADEDAGMALGTKTMADHVDRELGDAFQELLTLGKSDSSPPLEDLFSLLVVVNRLERVSDQAKNICEEAVFTATGEVKPPKVYRVLFVDQGGRGLNVLAEAIARKGFPESGSYASASLASSGVIPSAVATFMEDHGLGIGHVVPLALPLMAAQHVVVSLAGDLRPHVADIPYQTVVLEWDAAGAEEGDLEVVYKDLAWRIRDLMETLRGEGAS